MATLYYIGKRTVTQLATWGKLFRTDLFRLHGMETSKEFARGKINFGLAGLYFINVASLLFV
jgi:hypothetical protein